MEFLNQTFSELGLYDWDERINDWFLLVSLAFLGFELLRLLLKRVLTWNILGDTVTNFITFTGFTVLYFVLLGAFYVGIFYYVYENYRLLEIPITPWSIALCILLADLAYYWEHRFSHRVGVAWASHTVHHSSPYFNISVAYRFGPLDGLIPLPFHLPLVILGFNPALVLFAESMNLLYQTALHTETIGKLPKPVEAVMNTPSHHRVHHGANRRYLDKNFGGILIVWDKLFGTFAEEREKVAYGLTEQIDSVNPLVVFFHGFTRLAKQVWNAKGLGNKLGRFILPPGWRPDKNDRDTARASPAPTQVLASAASRLSAASASSARSTGTKR